MIDKIKKQFIERQINHIRLVQDLAIILELNLDKLPFKVDEWEILNRCMQHDLDKFEKHNANQYKRIEEYYSNKREGIDNSYIDLDKLYDCSKKHYKTQRHHTQYHDINGEEYSNVDICEICCDIVAVSIRNKDNSYGKNYCINTLFPQNPKLNKRKDNILKILELLVKYYKS